MSTLEIEQIPTRKDNYIGSPSPFEGKFVLKHNTPVSWLTFQRVGHRVVLARPNIHLEPRGPHTYGALVV